MATYEDALATVDAAQRRTRRVKRAGWIPLLIFGILVLPAVIFHAQHRRAAIYDAGGGRVGIEHLADPTGGQGLFWYWQLAIPLGYLLVAGLYTIRSRWAGVRSPVKGYVVTGVILIIALYYFANTAVAPLRWSNFGMHGMDATITLGVALFALAWIEQSIALAIAAVVVTGVAVAAAQYDIANLWSRLFSWQAPAWLADVTNDLALSATLLVAALIVAVVDCRYTRPGRTA